VGLAACFFAPSGVISNPMSVCFKIVLLLVAGHPKGVMHDDAAMEIYVELHYSTLFRSTS
ncbi:MAG: hypothetical protein ABI040_09920, partial [Rhodoferax sp.]